MEVSDKGLQIDAEQELANRRLICTGTNLSSQTNVKVQVTWISPPLCICMRNLEKVEQKQNPLGKKKITPKL